MNKTNYAKLEIWLSLLNIEVLLTELQDQNRSTALLIFTFHSSSIHPFYVIRRVRSVVISLHFFFRAGFSCPAIIRRLFFTTQLCGDGCRSKISHYGPNRDAYIIFFFLLLFLFLSHLIANHLARTRLYARHYVFQ